MDVIVFSTGWRQEEHPATKSLDQLPRIQYRPILSRIFLHSRPFPVCEGHGESGEKTGAWWT